MSNNVLVCEKRTFWPLANWTLISSPIYSGTVVRLSTIHCVISNQQQRLLILMPFSICNNFLFDCYIATKWHRQMERNIPSRNMSNITHLWFRSEISNYLQLFLFFCRRNTDLQNYLSSTLSQVCFFTLWDSTLSRLCGSVFIYIHQLFGSNNVHYPRSSLSRTWKL